MTRSAFCDECRVELDDAQVCRLWGLALCGPCWIVQFEIVWQRHPGWREFCPKFERWHHHCADPCNQGEINEMMRATGTD